MLLNLTRYDNVITIITRGNLLSNVALFRTLCIMDDENMNFPNNVHTLPLYSTVVG